MYALMVSSSPLMIFRSPPPPSPPPLSLEVPYLKSVPIVKDESNNFFCEVRQIGTNFISFNPGLGVNVFWQFSF